MKVAVFGCLHGMLNEMYKHVSQWERDNQSSVDLVIVCGDCQTVRAYADLKCVSIPPKYHQLGDFHEYYAGKREIPKLTIFVGGNHEASNYLSTLPYGGWVCKNFYYIGYAGVVRYRNLRIGGISGIYNSRSSHLGRYEHLPFDDRSMRTVYHTREIDVYRLQQLSPATRESSEHQMSIFLSHDWPLGIYNHGDAQQLCRYKRHLEDEIRRNCLGNPLTAPLVGHIKPKHWFAAHLHCQFRAHVEHSDGLSTDFLSLDKIVPRHRFMEIIDIDCEQNNDTNLYYDLEWLAVLKLTDSFTTTEYEANLRMAKPSDAQHRPTRDDLELVERLLKGPKQLNSDSGTMSGDDPGRHLRIPDNFEQVEPVIYNRPNGAPVDSDENRTKNYRNCQTAQLCHKLAIRDPISDFVIEDVTIVSVVGAPDKTSSTSLSSSSRRKQVRDHDEARNAEQPLKIVRLDGCVPFFINKQGDNSD